MFTIVFGYKETRGRDPVLVYAGGNGADAVAAAQKREKEFAYFGRVVNPTVFNMHLPPVETKPAAQPAVQPIVKNQTKKGK